LIGALPALSRFWIRRNIPEPEEWETARTSSKGQQAWTGRSVQGRGVEDDGDDDPRLLRRAYKRSGRSSSGRRNSCRPAGYRKWTTQAKQGYTFSITALATLAAIGGNFVAAYFARRVGYRFAAALMFFRRDDWNGVGVWETASARRDVVLRADRTLLRARHLRLFPMYIPPLFPVLLRATGAGFCYNIGRVVAAGGTVVFGLMAKVGDYRLSLFLRRGFLYSRHRHCSSDS